MASRASGVHDPKLDEAFAKKLKIMFEKADKGFGMVAGKMDGAGDGGLSVRDR